jgi:hypothetical protein
MNMPVEDVRTPSELEARRREIVHALTHQYKGYDDPDIPMPLLQELAIITSTLRRKNAGPPREKRPAAPRRTATVDDL